jgi:hypothetical protein
VTAHNIYDSISYDTMKIGSGVICNNSVTDTFYLSSKIMVNYTLYDSVLLGAHSDTVILSIRDVSRRHVNLYPNPAGDMITLEMKDAGILNAVIYDAKGAKLRTMSCRYPYRVNTAALVPGLYFLTVTDSEGRHFYARFQKE